MVKYLDFQEKTGVERRLARGLAPKVPKLKKVGAQQARNCAGTGSQGAMALGCIAAAAVHSV
jgi:hypothetical protein